MDPHDVYIRSLLIEYRVHRQELIVFTIIFIFAALLVPVAWFVNHVGHQFRFGWMIAAVAASSSLVMATHCGNTLKVLRKVTTALNKEMGTHQTFGYDQGKETDPFRYFVTLVAKVIAVLILIWCFTPWPQL